MRTVFGSTWTAKRQSSRNPNFQGRMRAGRPINSPPKWIACKIQRTHGRVAVICHEAAGVRFSAIVDGGRAEPAPSLDPSLDNEIPK